jgi:tRNA pseudouridine38-40 synthase
MPAVPRGAAGRETWFANRVRTLKLTVAYDGTRFVGWQRQAEGVSIQGLLEEALARLEGGAVTVHGAGRTDAGVHALGQVASAQLTSAHSVGVVARALNACLPPEVRVTRIEQVADDFHARYSARSKTYRYVIRNAPVVSPFERAYVWHVPDLLDREAMRQGAAALLGAHDFAAFRSVGGEVRTTTRRITQSEFAIDADTTRLVYEITGDGFLRHMVRAIVGTLVETGRGQRPAASIAALLASGSRAEAGATAPPQGLFLVRVDYD